MSALKIDFLVIPGPMSGLLQSVLGPERTRVMRGGDPLNNWGVRDVSLFNDPFS